MSFRPSITDNARFEAKVVEAVRKRREYIPLENNIYEFKSELPTNDVDFHRLARQLAGHANAARGNPIIWIIGVRDDGELIGVKEFQTDILMPKLTKYFDQNETPHSLLNMNVNIPGTDLSVMAIEFSTDRAPYVIKSKNSDSTEVPWRENSLARGIRRDELLKLLVPTLDAVRIEPRWGQLRIYNRNSQSGSELRYEMALTVILYLVPPPGRLLVLPFHRSTARILSQVTLSTLTIYEGCDIGSPARAFPAGSEPKSHTIRNSSSEVLIDGPGMIQVECTGNIHPISFDATKAESIELELAEAYTEELIHLKLEMAPTTINERELIGHWKYPAKLHDDSLPREFDPIEYTRLLAEMDKK